MNEPKKHHYLPQFYLKRFTEGDGKLTRTWMSPAGELVTQRSSPRSSGFEHRLYSYRPETQWTPPRPAALETDFMSPLDDRAAPALDAILRGAGSVTLAERQDWAQFVNSLLERTPQALSDLGEQVNASAKATCQELLDSAPNAESKARRAQVVQELDMESVVHNQTLGLMVARIAEKDDVEALAGMHLQIVRTPHQQSFTGDCPVVINFGNPRPLAVYSITLSPGAIMIASFEDLRSHRELLGQAAWSHLLKVSEQSTFLISRSTLSDEGPFKMMSLAKQSLPPTPWRKT